jgi:putative acetyltransferase
MNIRIRNETASDIEAISQVTEAAFLTLPISRHTEQFIISALRTANALTVSLVAEAEHKVVGHIAFSPVTISDGSPGWYGLGSVAVAPEYFLCLPFGDSRPSGTVRFHAAFAATG